MDFRWIWSDGTPAARNRHDLFARRFTLQKLPERAILYIAANDQYGLTVNGTFVDCGIWNDWPGYQAYDTLDVTGYLREGENELRILLYWQGENTMQRACGAPRLGFRLEADGEAVAESDENCRFTEETGYENGPQVEYTNFQMGYAFHYDARVIPQNWRQVQPAAAPHTLFPRPVPKCELLPVIPSGVCAQGLFLRGAEKDACAGLASQMALFTPRRVGEIFGAAVPRDEFVDGLLPLPQEKGCAVQSAAFDNAAGPSYDGCYLIVDLGREEAGLVTLELEAPAGTVIDVGYGEHLDDGRVRTNIDGKDGPNYAFRYIAGEGRQQFLYPLRRVAGRYLQLMVYGRAFTLYHASVRPMEYPLPMDGAFVTPDRLSARIWDVSRRTLALCMHEHYEDCPWREQALYGMDSRNQALAGYYAFGEYAFPAASFALMARGMREDNHLWITSPTGAVPGVPSDIPSFDLAWAVECGELALYSGNPALLQEVEQPLIHLLDGFYDRVRDGVLYNDVSPTSRHYWHFYEWSDGFAGESNPDGEAEAPLNAFFIMALENGARVMRLLGRDADALRFAARAETVRKAFHAAFWDEAEGAYRTAKERRHFGELSQALALWAGAVPEALQKPLRARLAEPENGLVTLTISHYIYKMDALMQEPETYAAVVQEDIARVWGEMLSRGATSFWETIGGGDAFGKRGSLCHGWSAIPAYFYGKYVLGVTPVEPGFRSFRFAPVCPDCTADGVVPTPYGPIVVKNQQIAAMPALTHSV